MATLKRIVSYFNKDVLIFISFLCLTIIEKIIPHLPNFSPELAFSIYLVMRYKKMLAIFSIFLMWLLCDFYYALIHNAPVLGNWALLTYSALLILVLFFSVFRFKKNNAIFIFLSILASSFFWLWTNFGVWLFSGMYFHSVAGLIACYVLALPFLGYSLISAIFWSTAITIVDYFSRININWEKLYIYVPIHLDSEGG